MHIVTIAHAHPDAHPHASVHAQRTSTCKCPCSAHICARGWWDVFELKSYK